MSDEALERWHALQRAKNRLADLAPWEKHLTDTWKAKVEQAQEAIDEHEEWLHV